MAMQLKFSVLTQLDKLEAFQWTRKHFGKHGLEHLLDFLAPGRIHVGPQLPHDAAQEPDVLGIVNVDPVLGQAGQRVGRSLGGAGALLGSRAAILIQAGGGRATQSGDGAGSGCCCCLGWFVFRGSTTTTSG